MKMNLFRVTICLIAAFFLCSPVSHAIGIGKSGKILDEISRKASRGSNPDFVLIVFIDPLSKYRDDILKQVDELADTFPSVAPYVIFLGDPRDDVAIRHPFEFGTSLGIFEAIAGGASVSCLPFYVLLNSECQTLWMGDSPRILELLLPNHRDPVAVPRAEQFEADYTQVLQTIRHVQKWGMENGNIDHVMDSLRYFDKPHESPAQRARRLIITFYSFFSTRYKELPLILFLLPHYPEKPVAEWLPINEDACGKECMLKRDYAQMYLAYLELASKLLVKAFYVANDPAMAETIIAVASAESPGYFSARIDKESFYREYSPDAVYFLILDYPFISVGDIDD